MPPDVPPRPQTSHLVASHPGNEHRLVHGAFSKDGRALEPRVAEVVDELSRAPHITELAAVAVREAARLAALVEAVDQRISQRLSTDKREPTSLLDIRQRYSRRVADWLDRLGATPAGRAAWAATMAQGGLAAEIAAAAGRGSRGRGGRVRRGKRPQDVQEGL